MGAVTPAQNHRLGTTHPEASGGGVDVQRRARGRDFQSRRTSGVAALKGPSPSHLKSECASPQLLGEAAYGEDHWCHLALHVQPGVAVTFGPQT